MTLKHQTPAPVRVLDAPDGHDVIIEGRLDVHTVPDIRDAIHEVIHRGSGELRLHLAHAEIGDATGLGVILHLHRRATRAERRMYLIDPSERTTRLLRGCRLDRLLTSRHSGVGTDAGRTAGATAGGATTGGATTGGATTGGASGASIAVAPLTA